MGRKFFQTRGGIDFVSERPPRRTMVENLIQTDVYRALSKFRTRKLLSEYLACAMQVLAVNMQRRRRNQCRNFRHNTNLLAASGAGWQHLNLGRKKSVNISDGSVAFYTFLWGVLWRLGLKFVKMTNNEQHFLPTRASRVKLLQLNFKFGCTFLSLQIVR